MAKAKHHHQLPALGILTKGNYAGIDQGVDFRGAGNVPAIGAGIVTDVGITHIIETGNKIWHYVIYRITSGPLKGQFVYVAENIKPTVKVGQRVSFGQTVAHALGTYPYIETGFNKSAKGWNAFGTLNGPQPQGAAMWKYLLQLGSNRITRVKVNGKWYRIRNGHWIGKGPPNYHGASYLGELGHYAIHPGQGVAVTAGAVGGIADSALKRVLYAVVMVGGFLLVLTGMAMIGLDLTLGKNATARKVVSAAGLGGIAAARMNRRAERPPTDREQMSAYRRGERQGTLQGARREGARVARSRIATPQNLKPKPKYSGKEDSGNVPF